MLYWNRPSNGRRLQDVTIDPSTNSTDTIPSTNSTDTNPSTNSTDFGEATLRNDDIYAFLTDNAAEVCYDPRPHDSLVDPPIENKNFKLAFTHVWYFFDTDRNGLIEPIDIRTNYFNLKAESPSGEVDKTIFDGQFKKNLLELCFESAIIYSGDDTCIFDKDQSVYRANRCNNNEKGDLFALFDANDDGVLSGTEFSNPLRNGDSDGDFLLSPEEFLFMVREN